MRTMVLENRKDVIQHEVELYFQRGWRELCRNETAGYVSVEMERDETPLEKAIECISNSGVFSDDQINTLIDAFTALAGEE